MTAGWLDDTMFAAIPGAVTAGLVAGTLLPLLGVWVVVQRVVFLGVALAQVAAAGVALGLVLGAPPLPLGLAAALLVTGFVVRGGRTQASDGTLGALFCASSALALMFVSRSPAELDEVDHVLRGNLIYADTPEVLLTAATLLGAVLVVWRCRRPILFAVFDAETATALGVSARSWRLLLFAVLAASLSVCMRTTGSLLSFAMLVLPALAALGLGVGLRGTFTAAGLLGGVGTAAGLTLAVAADLHVESSITVALAAWLPVIAAWRLHPLAGVGTLVATAGLGVWLGLAMGVEPVAHPHHHEAAQVHEQPWHADVRLTAKQVGDGGTLQVAWEIDLHRRDADVSLPDDLWIVLTGEGLTHEHELVHDLSLLPVGVTRERGSCLVPVSEQVHRVEGQLWTGSVLTFDAEPLDAARGDVVGADVTR